MPALPDIQSRFYAAIMADEYAAAENALLEVLDENSRRGRRRLAAYRRSIFGNLFNALATSYPVLVRIVGLSFFREAARNYILAHPSLSGDLNDYGEHFASFIAAYPYAQDMPYLGDVARLEWTVQALLNAAEAPPADISALASTPPERYGDLTFEPDPCCARLDSPWPLHEIWEVNQASHAGEMQVDFTQGSSILVRRRNGAVSVQGLSAAEAAFFDALGKQASLAHAAAAALEKAADFDFGGTLQQWIANGLLHRASLASSGEPAP